MNHYIVPKGKYYLGDPCYCFQNHKNWSDVLDASDCFDEPYQQGKKVAIAFNTAYGDGLYFDQKGNEFPVDAGMIGLVPISMADCKPTGVLLVDFKIATECRRDGGTLYFGDYIIKTDNSDEGEE